MNRIAPLSFLFLMSFLLMGGGIKAQALQKHLTVIGDLSADVTLRRETLAQVLKEVRGPKLAPLMDLFWQPEVLATFLDSKNASSPKSLEGRLASKPEFIRFLASAFQHPESTMRRESVAWSAHSTWPWLLRRRLRAFKAEEDKATRTQFLTVISGALKSEEATAVRGSRRGLEAEKGALFRLGLARAPRSQRVQAWPGGRNWKERGFSTVQEFAPYRSIMGRTARIPCPLAREAESILIGLRRTSTKKRGIMRVSMAGKSIGEFAIGTSTRLEEIIEIRLAKPRSLIDQEITLDFDANLKGQIQLRAIVALEVVKPHDNAIAVEVLFDEKVVAKSHGVKLATAKTGGLIITGKEAHIAVNIPAFGGRARRLDLDHWSASDTPGVWDVTLNGKPLVRLISQRLPRPAKCFPNRVKLAPGRNELIFTQVSGAELHLEAIRFVR